MAKIMKKAQDGYMAKIKKSAASDTTTKKGLSSGLSGNPLFKKASEMKDTTTYKKSKSGGSFPDLNKDGKITKADILKGRGVIAKKGAKMKMGGAMAKQAATAIAMKKAGKKPKAMMQYGGKSASMAPMMKKGGKAMGKCKYGC
jgi:hypothetical protein